MIYIGGRVCDKNRSTCSMITTKIKFPISTYFRHIATNDANANTKHDLLLTFPDVGTTTNSNDYNI